MEFVKPARLTKNSTVALVSLSWGGPHAFPHVYELGVKNLQKMGLKIKEFATAKADPNFLYENPKIRADDVNKAFADPEVDGIVSTIGGEDSIRILPYLDGKTIRSNPKIFIGILRHYNSAGVLQPAWTSYFSRSRSHGRVLPNGKPASVVRESR